MILAYLPPVTVSRLVDQTGARRARRQLLRFQRQTNNADSSSTILMTSTWNMLTELRWCRYRLDYYHKPTEMCVIQTPAPRTFPGKKKLSVELPLLSRPYIGSRGIMKTVKKVRSRVDSLRRQNANHRVLVADSKTIKMLACPFCIIF